MLRLVLLFVALLCHAASGARSDPFKTLGISKHADDVAVKRRYNRLASTSEYSPAANRVFSDVTDAYEKVRRHRIQAKTAAQKKLNTQMEGRRAATQASYARSRQARATRTVRALRAGRT